MGAHAILSASGAYRWMRCTPSARIEQNFEDRSSDFAKEGSLAHELGELLLAKELGILDKKDVAKKLKAIEKSQFYSQEMKDYVDKYVDYVLERLAEHRVATEDAEILLESRLDFSDWVPEGFGTGDTVIVSDGYLEIIDFKYGKGVPVSAEENPQMRLYSLGAYKSQNFLYDITKIRATIFQPRLDNISIEELTKDELLAWAENELVNKAKLAHMGEGEFVAGDHCRFCKAKYTCRARAEANLEMAKFDFKDAALLSNNEIGEILEKADELQKWAKDIQAYALEQAEKHGIKFPGWKLVEGRSNRKYLDESAVVSTLTSAGFEEDSIFKKTLLGITDMEKVIGKKKFNEILSDLVIKPSGKPALVPESDKRPELNSAVSAAEDFK